MVLSSEKVTDPKATRPVHWILRESVTSASDTWSLHMLAISEIRFGPEVSKRTTSPKPTIP